MPFNYASFIYFLSLYALRCLASCPTSKQTITYVSSCPKSLAEWKWRADAKKCWLVKQQCTQPHKFVYHCVINSYANSTLEVCAPAVHVIGHSCVEFNMLGGLVQDSPYLKCKTDCPFSYNSTDVYKYQTCFNVANKTDERKCSHCICAFAPKEYTRNNASASRELAESNPKSREEIWQIVAIILLIITVALIAYIVWIVIHRKRKSKREKDTVTSGIDDAGSRRLQEYNKVKDEEGGPENPLICPTDTDTNTTEEGEKSKSSPKPTRRTEIENPKWISSIYIGEKYCGMAYINPKSPEDVVPVGNVERIGALMNKDGKVEEFGDNARKKYIENCDKSTTSIFLDELDMDQEKTKIGSKTFPTSKVYQEIIRYLRLRIHNKMSTSIDKKEKDEVLHVITVPRHWHNKIKNLQKLFEEAGTGDKKEKLHIQLRELAISPYIHEVKASVLCLNFNVDNLTLKRNTTYANLHIGSKYCNLMFLKVEDSNKPDKFIDKATATVKWDTTPENQFVRIIEKIFSTPTVKKWKENHHSEYISLMCQFEEKMKKMCEITDGNEEFEVKLSPKLTDLHDLSLLDIMQTADGIEGLKLENNGTKLIMSWSLFKDCFSGVKIQTQAIIKENAATFENNDVHCVIMTGCYSQMKTVLSEAETKWFQELNVRITVAIPVHIGSTFAMGAAYFMHKFPDRKID